MKWIVGFIAIVIVVIALLGTIYLIDMYPLLLVAIMLLALVVAMYLLIPAVGEIIIDWFNVQKWNRDHPWPPSNLSEGDLEIMRKHTHNE